MCNFMAVVGMEDLPKQIEVFKNEESMYKAMDEYNRGKLHPDIFISFFVNGWEVNPVFNEKQDVIGHNPA